MPIEVNVITDKQLQEVLSYTESHFLDVKAKEIKPSKLTKAISAFANADGGELYIGISDKVTLPFPQKWSGFADPEDANAHVQVFENLFPLGEDYSYCFLSHPTHTGVVLQVTVRKTKAIVKASDGVPYIRRGAQSLPVDTPTKLATLERNKGITSFENETVSVDLTTVTNSEAIIKFILEVVPSSEPEAWLRKQELIRDGKPTVAAVLLFSDLPQAILPKRTGVKIYRYKTSLGEGTRDTLVGDPLSVEGCAYDLIKESVRITKEIISGIQILGTQGLEAATYPTESCTRS
jgi:ATP-dependent DNA helicase RecG